MNIPTIFDKNAFLNAPLNYKWKDSTAGFYYVDAKNSKIYEAISKLNYKATMGMLTALCEWIYYRVSSHVDSPEPLARMAIEAQWASIVDKHYSFKWQYGGNYKIDPANGPIYAMLKIMANPRGSYYNGDSQFKDIDNLAMLARHIAPDQFFFDDWFKKTLAKATHLFPFEATIDNPAENYDCTLEPAIPREFFFEPDYDYETADNSLFINKFLSSLDYKNSKLLNSPEKMLELGFIGIPYQYEHVV